MDQMIYKLNLPPFEECILDGVDEKFFQTEKDFQYLSVSPEEIFKKEYIALKNLNWTLALIFSRRHGARGAPHSDSPYPDSITTWGINWIYKGHGIMEYWELEDFDPENRERIVDQGKYPILTCKATKSPRLTYHMSSGSYLVNTSKIHRVSGFQTRYAISLRCDCNKSWNQVVDLFDDLIKK